jgi:hypothetical protein
VHLIAQRAQPVQHVLQQVLPVKQVINHLEQLLQEHVYHAQLVKQVLLVDLVQTVLQILIMLYLVKHRVQTAV